MRVRSLYALNEKERAEVISHALTEEKIEFLACPFNAKGYAGKNIIVTQWSDLSRPYVVVNAHYDGCGAYDNLGGTLVLFWMLKWMKQVFKKGNYLFAFFDGEERGLLGASSFLQGFGSKDIAGHLSLDGFGIGNSIGCFANLKEVVLKIDGKAHYMPLQADTMVFQEKGIPSLHCFSLPYDELKALIENNIFPPAWHILHTRADSPRLIEDIWLPLLARQLVGKLDTLRFNSKGTISL